MLCRVDISVHRAQGLEDDVLGDGHSGKEGGALRARLLVMVRCWTARGLAYLHRPARSPNFASWMTSPGKFTTLLPSMSKSPSLPKAAGASRMALA